MSITGFVTCEISGDRLDFDYINKHICKPTNIYKKDDTDDKYDHIVQGSDRWIYEIEFGEDQDLNDVLVSFISTLNGKRTYLDEICKLNTARLWCDVYSDFAQFGFVFKQELINKLAQLGLGVELHCYSHGDIK